MKNLFLLLLSLVIFTSIGCEKNDIQPNNTNSTSVDSIAYYINTGVYIPYNTTYEHELKGIVNYQANSLNIDSSGVDSVFFYIDFTVSVDFQAEHQRYLTLISQGGTINNLYTPTHVAFNSYQCFIVGGNNTHLDVFKTIINPIVKLNWAENTSGLLFGEGKTTMMIKYERSGYEFLNQSPSKWWRDEYNVRTFIAGVMQSRTFIMAPINANKGRYWPGATWNDNL